MRLVTLLKRAKVPHLALAEDLSEGPLFIVTNQRLSPGALHAVRVAHAQVIDRPSLARLVEGIEPTQYDRAA